MVSSFPLGGFSSLNLVIKVNYSKLDSISDPGKVSVLRVIFSPSNYSVGGATNKKRGRGSGSYSNMMAE